MHAKIAFLILALGATACGLLLHRQQRLMVVHEMASIEQRVLSIERSRARLAVEIARATTPRAVERMAASLGVTRPMSELMVLPDSVQTAALPTPWHLVLGGTSEASQMHPASVMDRVAQISQEERQ